jgi:hypothetical protein
MSQKLSGKGLYGRLGRGGGGHAIKVVEFFLILSPIAGAAYPNFLVG